MNTRIEISEDPETHHAGALRIHSLISEGKATKADYYWIVSKWARTAIGRWCQMRDREAVAAAKNCVQAVLDYFYGDWRERLITMDGKKGEEAWRQECLWLEEVQRSLPLASALSDWEAVKRIAAYPPEDMFPEAAKAKGEAAWGWAVITYLRGEPRRKVEAFLAKADGEKAKRPKLLAPVLRALIDKDERKFSDALLAYLRFYRKSEFKTGLDQAVALDGTTLFHLGRKLGFKMELPQNIANHVVRFE